MMFWPFDSAIRRGVKKGVDDFLASDRFKAMIRDAAKKVWLEELAKPENAWLVFVKRIQNCLLKADPSLTGKRSFDMALGVYRQHLRDENIKYGDPRFDWSADGARDLAQAYEIDYWEPTP